MQDSRPVKILVTSAGSTHGVNVIQALRVQREMRVMLYAADANPLSAGLFMADEFFVVPKADDPEFIPRLIAICQEREIGILIPTFSFELPVVAAAKEELEKNGIKTAIPSVSVFEETEDKNEADRRFRELGIPVPRLYSDEEVRRGKVEFPVIVKPRKESGSKGVVRVETRRGLERYAADPSRVVVQEYIEGEEYTIDGLCDLAGSMIAASPRLRIETRGGLAVKSMTVRDERMEAYARTAAEGFGIIGPFNLQCFRNPDGGLVFIEINSRFPSGGLPLAVKAGFNIPLGVVKLLRGERVAPPRIRPGVVMLRYWDALFVEETREGFRSC